MFCKIYDTLYDSFSILIDHFVIVSQHCNALLIKVCRAYVVSLVGKGCLMYIPIQFYTEVKFVTEEIKHIGTNWVLSAKTDA